MDEQEMKSRYDELDAERFRLGQYISDMDRVRNAMRDRIDAIEAEQRKMTKALYARLNKGKPD